MFGHDPSPQLILSLVAVWLLSVFLVGIGHRFIETITDRATETHLGGGLVSGLYLGFNVDPDMMIIRELVSLTPTIDSSSLSFILASLTVLSVIEIILGLLYILDKRGKIGVLGSVLVICSGYAFPKVEEAGIILLLFGMVFYVSSKKSEF